MKIIGGTDKDKEDEARKRADALAKAIIKMLPQHLSHGELLAVLSSVLAAAFAEDGTREGVLRAMRDLTASVLAEFGALKRRHLGQRRIQPSKGRGDAEQKQHPAAARRGMSAAGAVARIGGPVVACQHGAGRHYVPGAGFWRNARPGLHRPQKGVTDHLTACKCKMIRFRLPPQSAARHRGLRRGGHPNLNR